MSDNEIQLVTSVHDEVTSWLFDDYLPTWVGVADGTITRGPEFILDYWAAPLHFSTDQGGQWFHDASAVVQFLEEHPNAASSARVRLHRRAGLQGQRI